MNAVSNRTWNIAKRHSFQRKSVIRFDATKTASAAPCNRLTFVAPKVSKSKPAGCAGVAISIASHEFLNYFYGSKRNSLRSNSFLTNP